MRHFLDVYELSREEFWDILSLARRLKAQYREWQQNTALLRGYVLGMLFQKPSLRTRVSFEVAMLHLGGQALYLSPNEVQLGQRESVPDVARVLGRYVHAIMARVFSHEHVRQLAHHAGVPVINGLSDYSHPCQALADYFTLWERWGTLEGRTLAWVGDGNNVLHSLLHGAPLAGVNVRVATPPGYEPDEGAVDVARRGGVDVLLTNDPREAVRGADAIYTDVWASMGQEAERAERLRVFPPYQVNQALLEASGNPDVVVLHCLPAHRGEEITDDVADGPHSLLWDQAENRLHAQKGLLVWLLVT
ncbi:MAG: ornithine carbamoyltransferase [Ardenticatenia bacterium]|nr:ornithine carbamoyltransferase [Ardenticatenia bacterium]